MFFCSSTALEEIQEIPDKQMDKRMTLKLENVYVHMYKVFFPKSQVLNFNEEVKKVVPFFLKSYFPGRSLFSSLACVRSSQSLNKQ